MYVHSVFCMCVSLSVEIQFAVHVVSSVIDVPDEVEIQLGRSEFIASKVIENIPDEQEELDVSKEDMDFVIEETDNGSSSDLAETNISDDHQPAQVWQQIEIEWYTVAIICSNLDEAECINK